MFTVQIRATNNDGKEVLIPAVNEDGSWRSFVTRKRASDFLRRWVDQIVGIEGGTLTGVIFCPSTGMREEIPLHCRI